MKFGLIGFGNLGKAFSSALLCTGDVVADDIYVCDKSEQALSLAKKGRFHVYSMEDINKVIAETDIICIIVKGYVFEEISKLIDKKALTDKLVISLMAGETFDDIYTQIGNVKLARAMPSLAIATNEGVIAYTKIPGEVADIFNKFGFAFETEPDVIEKVMAFAACGLGYAAYLIDAFTAAGEAMGFSLDTASHIAALSFKNAGDIGNFRETVKAVATPGGATEQGVNYMDECDVYGIVAGAIQKAYERMT
ncbi:MAG: NAD(P)-binding domain-containing protein [Oscillospiraceae bacterium]|nr:NAD(P)-binding domain-containing protein [Oscillospiraceae bacterium]